MRSGTARCWISFYGAVTALEAAYGRILAMTDVNGRARLPVSSRTQSRILRDFVIPDHWDDELDDQEDLW